MNCMQLQSIPLDDNPIQISELKKGWKIIIYRFYSDGCPGYTSVPINILYYPIINLMRLAYHNKVLENLHLSGSGHGSHIFAWIQVPKQINVSYTRQVYSVEQLSLCENK